MNINDLKPYLVHKEFCCEGLRWRDGDELDCICGLAEEIRVA